MALDLFELCARFNYQLMRYFFYTKLYYNKDTKRLEIRARNSCLRQTIHYTMDFIVAAYGFVLIAIPLNWFMKHWRQHKQFADVQLILILYFSVVFIVHIISLATILFQLQCQETSCFLKRFLNEFFQMQADIAQLCGQQRHDSLELCRLLLLLFKFAVIIVAFIASTRVFNSLLTHIINFPLFELAYIANYMMILRLLQLHETLVKYIRQLADRRIASETAVCRELHECRRYNEPLRRAIVLRGQTEKLLTRFVAYFGWFEKLLVLDNMLCVHLTKQFIMCVIYQGKFFGALVPLMLKYVLNMLLIGMLSDAYNASEAELSTILTILESELSRRGEMCADCGELLRELDIYFCGQNLRANRIPIFRGFYWTREYVFDLLHSLISFGVSLTQLEKVEEYSCKFV